MPGLTDISRFVNNSRALPLLLLGLLFLGMPRHAAAQISTVQIDVPTENTGIGGYVQRGSWTPVLVELENNGADNLAIDCRWLLSDDDGDELVAERKNITLQPDRKTRVWLYANPPMSTRADAVWVFQAVSSETGELLTQFRRELIKSTFIDPSVNLVGVSGLSNLGLNVWENWFTQHEQIKRVEGINLKLFPDRWYGLDALSALVWVPGEGGDPADIAFSDASKRALREWVYRGGHLVIIMPYAGETWSKPDSGLADLIKPRDDGELIINRINAPVPFSVFPALRSTDPVQMLAFDISKAPGYTALASINLPAKAETDSIDDNPTLEQAHVIVGHRVGFGQVTLVGMDLSNTSPVVKAVTDPYLHKVWTRIFSWRASKTGELIPEKVFEDDKDDISYMPASGAKDVELGTWIAERVARQKDTAPAIGFAVVLFILYGIAAALTFPNLLRKRHWERHSWALFVCIVVVFSTVAWGGAWIMRPARTSAAHFTVLDIDGNTNFVHARSWQSLLIPSFTSADIAVPSDSDGFALMDVVNLLSSPGHSIMAESPGYPDRQTYAFDSTQPDRASVPMRSTTKSLLIDFLGQITARSDAMPNPWKMPKAELTVNANGVPSGSITHFFPDTMTDVHIIYCPGGPQQIGRLGDTQPPGRPLVYTFRIKDVNSDNYNQSLWPAKTPLALPSSLSAYRPLWLRPATTSQQGTDRAWAQEGFLGQQVDARKFGQGGIFGGSSVVKDIPLLTFYDALPPPNYEAGSGENAVYSRSLMRKIDLTHLITGRRIIIIGHLRNSPSPVPFTVDGEGVDSQGWTVVRWIYDL